MTSDETDPLLLSWSGSEEEAASDAYDAERKLNDSSSSQDLLTAILAAERWLSRANLKVEKARRTTAESRKVSTKDWAAAAQKEALVIMCLESAAKMVWRLADIAARRGLALEVAK